MEAVVQTAAEVGLDSYMSHVKLTLLDGPQLRWQIINIRFMYLQKHYTSII